MSGPPPSVSQSMAATDSGDGADGRKAKRELSQSKRAAQNRAAQVSHPTPLYVNMSLTEPFGNA